MNLDVTPTLSSLYFRDCCLVDTVKKCYFRLCPGHCPYFFYIIFCEFSPGISFPYVRCLSILFDLIVNIILIRPKKKMFWVNTAGIIASMQTVQLVRNIPIVEYPRNAMCTSGSRFVVKEAVSFGMPCTDPLPAVICLFNFIKESFFIFIHCTALSPKGVVV